MICRSGLRPSRSETLYSFLPNSAVQVMPRPVTAVAMLVATAAPATPQPVPGMVKSMPNSDPGRVE